MGLSVDRARFEDGLIRRARRVSRRWFLAGGVAAGGLLVATSFRGRPTRVGGFQGTPEASPFASPVASPVMTDMPFKLGVASGDPVPDGVVLWTRLAPDPLNGGGMEPVPVAVQWEVAVDEGFGQVVQSGTATAVPELAHSVHVDVTGLEPGRGYFYRFMVGSEVSPTGRTKTGPAAGTVADRLAFAVASCQHWEDGWFTAYRHMAAEDLDLVFHVGDYIYEYGGEAREGIVRQHNGDAEISSLDDYRNRYGQYKTDPDLQAAHAAFPWIVTWDDHEVENDYAEEMSENGDPIDLFLARRAAAYQAYYEHQPLRPESMPVGAAMQLYRRFDWGDLAGFSVLDTRQYRSDHPCGEGAQVRCPAATDPDTTMLGPEQERWVLAGLDASTARWNVLAQSVQMAELEQGPGNGELYWNDSWPGYPAARNRILGHIMSRQIANPIVLAGDIHTSWVNDLKADWRDPNSATIGSEFICTSISSEGDAPATFFEAFLPENPHIRFFDPRHGGYVGVTLTPDRWRGDVKVLQSVTTPDSPLTTAASFVVEAGQPGVQRA